jgi:hypothetical protein
MTSEVGILHDTNGYQGVLRKIQKKINSPSHVQR